MKELTKAEEQVMKHLWKLENAYLKDIVEQYPDPAPAYTTISTVVNVLVKKGFIGFEKHGKVRQYHPTISKDEYTRFSLRGMVDSFFDNSARKFASFFASQKDLSVEELQEIRRLIDQQIEERKK
jgi:predicted transcriptional regulator